MQINLTDKNEIEKTVEEFSDMIMRIAFQNVKQTSNAEDIMQEVFLALLKKRNFKNREHLKAWLIRVTINKCKDYLRSVTRREISLETVHPFVSVSECETITEEIFALPADDRNIIYLHYYDGYSAAEIGKIIKKSETAGEVNLVFTADNETYNSLKQLAETVPDGQIKLRMGCFAMTSFVFNLHEIIF